MQMHRILFHAPNEYTNTLLLKLQVGVNCFKNTYKFKMQVEIKFLRAAEQRGWMSTKHNPLARYADGQKLR